MKNYSLLLLLLPVFAFCYQSYVTLELDDKVSVEFPNLPTELPGGQNKIWTADVNESARCMATVINLGANGMTAAEVKQMIANPGSFAEFRNGVLEQMEGSSVISEKQGKTAGYPTFEFVINMGQVDSGAFKTMYNHNVFIGTNIYTVSVYELEGKPQPALGNRFFNSFKVKNM